MIEIIPMIACALPVTCAALGAGIGQGKIGYASLKAVNIQPQAAQEIGRVSLIGMALTETSAILGLVVSIMMLLHTKTSIAPEFRMYGYIGISIAMGITSFIAGITSSKPAQAACLAIARQPFFSNKIIQLMLLTQSIIVTPNIFGFIIALMIHGKISEIDSLSTGLQLLAAGMSVGIGSIGPSIGLSMFAASACSAVGANRKSYNKIVPFAFMCQGIIETPIIFSLLIALLILNMQNINNSSIQAVAFCSAALCMGLSTIATGINAGSIGASACEQIGKKPDAYSILSKVGLLALAMIDTFAIYGFIIAILLLYIL